MSRSDGQAFHKYRRVGMQIFTLKSTASELVAEARYTSLSAGALPLAYSGYGTMRFEEYPLAHTMYWYLIAASTSHQY